MTSPLLAVPGAIAPFDGLPDQGVPWHFGDPFAEQRSAARSVAVFDRSHRGVIAVPGEDRLTWLHSLTSQHFTALAEGRGTEALVLDVQGRVEHHAVVANVDGTVYLDMEARTTEPLLKYLDSMRFWSKVDPRDATAELAVLSLVGPEVADLLAKLDLPVPGKPDGALGLPSGGPAPTCSPGGDASPTRAPDPRARGRSRRCASSPCAPGSGSTPTRRPSRTR